MNGRPLFDEAAEALTALGFAIAPWEEWLEKHWDGVMDDLRSRPAAARRLVPGVVVEAVSGVDFYISFHPMRLAKRLGEYTDGALELQNVHLDPDELRWVYRFNGEERELTGGGPVLQRFVKQLNRNNLGWRFLVVKAGPAGVKLVGRPTKDLAPLRKVLGIKPGRRKAPPRDRTLLFDDTAPHDHLEWCASMAPRLFSLIPGAPPLDVERSADSVTVTANGQSFLRKWSDDDWLDWVEWLGTTLETLHGTTYELVFIRPKPAELGMSALTQDELDALDPIVISEFDLA